MTALNIRSWADVRAFLYVLLPVVSALLVTNGTLTENQASLWAGLATAVLGPVVAFANAPTVDAFRKAFYAVLGTGQAVLVGYGLITDAQIGVWLPLISVIVGVAGGGVAAANTNTTQ